MTEADQYDTLRRVLGHEAQGFDAMYNLRRPRFQREVTIVRKRYAYADDRHRAVYAHVMIDRMRNTWRITCGGQVKHGKLTFKLNTDDARRILAAALKSQAETMLAAELVKVEPDPLWART